jgi:hypothetical protein
MNQMTRFYDFVGSVSSRKEEGKLSHPADEAVGWRWREGN